MTAMGHVQRRRYIARDRARRRLWLTVVMLALLIVGATPAAAADHGDLGARLEVQADAAQLEVVAERSAPDSFAGLYIGEGGLVHVGFTRRVSRNLAVLKQQFRFPERLRGFRAAVTLRALSKTNDRVSRAMPRLQRQGIDVRSVGTAIERNRVEIGVVNLSEAERRGLLRRFGEVVVAVPLRAVENVSRGNSYPPLKGGHTIDSAQGLTTYSCTSAFVGQDGRSSFLLTAGHCGDVNSTWTHNVFFIGRMTRDSYRNGSSADAAAIRISSTDRSNLVFISDSNLRPIRGTNLGDVVGGAVCMSATTSGFVCGTITDTDETIDYGAVTLYRQRLASFPSIPGDSGGPIFSGNTAHGIVSGFVTYSDGNRDAIYSHIANAQSALGLRVRTCCR